MQQQRWKRCHDIRHFATDRRGHIGSHGLQLIATGCVVDDTTHDDALDEARGD
jgi:hypothetical protein